MYTDHNRMAVYLENDNEKVNRNVSLQACAGIPGNCSPNYKPGKEADEAEKLKSLPKSNTSHQIACFLQITLNFVKLLLTVEQTSIGFY